VLLAAAVWIWKGEIDGASCFPDWKRKLRRKEEPLACFTFEWFTKEGERIERQHLLWTYMKKL
jgi:hypothetical protein